MIIHGSFVAIRVQKKKSIMKQLMFIALALLLAACEKPVLDNEDAVTKKDANVILHFKQ